MIRYLEHYCKLSSWQAADGKVSDIDLSGLTLVCGNQTHRVPFDPPMASYRDARARVVEMDQACVTALGRSDISIAEFLPPTGVAAVPFAVCLATMLGYSQRWWFGRGEVVERVLGAGFARFGWTIQPWLIGFMVVVHGFEALYATTGKLSRHSVSPRSWPYWLWAADVFVEGVFAMKRFDKLVAQKREAKEKQKH